jgi:hypothetical protein
MPSNEAVERAKEAAHNAVNQQHRQLWSGPW